MFRFLKSISRIVNRMNNGAVLSPREQKILLFSFPKTLQSAGNVDFKYHCEKNAKNYSDYVIATNYKVIFLLFKGTSNPDAI